MFTISCCLVVGLGLGLGLCVVGKSLCTRICATLGCNCHGLHGVKLQTLIRTKP